MGDARSGQQEIGSRIGASWTFVTSLVDLLIAYGYVPQSETARLLRLSDQRNTLAHGQLDAVPSTIDLDFLIRLIEGLSIGGDH